MYPITMRKPKHCKQEWLDMKPTQGGRICGQCEKTIVDFTKMNWVEINRIQTQNNNTVCGIYNSKQLDYWGQEPPNRALSCKSVLAASSILLAMSQLIGTEAKAQNTEIIQLQSLDSIPTQTRVLDSSKSRIIQGTLTTINGNGEAEIIPFANVMLMKNSEGILGTTTDFDGKFKLEIVPSILLDEKFKIQFSCLGYQTKVVEFDKFNTAETNLEKDIDTHVILNTNLNQDVTAFYVEVPSRWKRIKWKVKRLFSKKD